MAKSHNLRVLYITYDGLLDPLGQSQIIPYLKAMCSLCETFKVLSFEKKQECNDRLQLTKEFLDSISVSWTILEFTKRLGLLGKLYDLFRMTYFSAKIIRKQQINLIHARSHPPAQVATLLKLIFRVRFIFDFRGLWVEERVDKGGWILSRKVDYFQYKINKFFEKKMLSSADHVVVLTKAVVPEIKSLGGISEKIVTVIPCCADYKHFRIPNESELDQTRGGLGIAQNSVVIGYLGSAGGMYRTDLFFKLFEKICRSFSRVYALALTPNPTLVNQYARVCLSEISRTKVIVLKADRDAVAKYLPLMSLLVSFVKGGPARISMSPTKLAESLACGVPFVTSEGVGDVDQLLRDTKGGLVINSEADCSFDNICENLLELIKLGGERLRMRSEPILGLQVAESRYQAVYSGLKRM